MYTNLAQLNSAIERCITQTLVNSYIATNNTPKEQDGAYISRLRLYEHVRQALCHLDISVVAYNRVLDDMKRVGQIGTTKVDGGSAVYFTLEARELLVETERKRRQMADEGAQS